MRSVQSGSLNQRENELRPEKQACDFVQRTLSVLDKARGGPRFDKPRRCARRSAKSSARAADAEASRSSATASAQILIFGVTQAGGQSSPLEHPIGLKPDGQGDFRIVDEAGAENCRPYQALLSPDVKRLSLNVKLNVRPAINIKLNSRQATSLLLSQQGNRFGIRKDHQGHAPCSEPRSVQFGPES
jgi:hypothetical protein